MSRDLFLTCLVAFFSVVVMLLGIKLAAAAEPATVDISSHAPCHVVDSGNRVASYHSAADGKEPVSAPFVTAIRTEDAEESSNRGNENGASR